MKDFRKGTCSTFWVFTRTLHPYVSLFTYFDYRLKRLTRFYFVLGQISLITLLLWIYYSKWIKKGDPELEQLLVEGEQDGGGEETDDETYLDLGWMGDEQRPFYVALILSLITLPLPRIFCCIFKT